MPAQITFRNSDGATAITSISLGQISPGSSYSAINGAPKKLHIANTGDEALSDVQLEIQQAGSDVSHQWGLLYPDDAGSANLSAPHPSGQVLSLGPMGVNDVMPFHLDAEVPQGQSGAPHLFNIYAIGLI